MMTYRELGGQMMKQIRIKTYDEKKNGEKWYLKDSNCLLYTSDAADEL